MKRFLLRGTGAALAALSFGCAARRGVSPRPAGAPPAAEARSFASPLEARATMLMLEDERRFDGVALEAAATHPVPAVRRAAAHATGAIGDGRGIALLLALARDGDAAVRGQAALGLEILGDARGSEAAASLLADADPAVVCAAGRAVGSLKTVAGEAALLEAIAREPRSCLLYALARFGNESASARARELASGKDADLRRAAIYAFARNPVAASASALTRALADPDGEAAGWAARGLGVLGDAAALPALGSALDRREPGARTLALNAIAQIEEKHPEALNRDRIARIVELARDADPSVATAALACLRWFQADREAYRSVHAQAVSGSGRRRVVAFLAEMAAVKDRARSRIEETTASPDVSLRAAAASAVAFLPEDAAAAPREEFLRDASPRVREAAIGTFPLDAAHRAELFARLSDPDPGVRSAVVERLAEAGDPTVLPEIAKTFPGWRGDPIADAALSAVRAARRLKGDAAKAILQVAADWPRTVVAREARQALVADFGGDPGALPLPAYATGRSLEGYERILEDASRPRRAVIRTARGTITIALDGATAPLTVANFAALARKKFFDGTAFDRVVPWFVIQGGDPTGTLHGGPGDEIRDELVEAGYERGSVGMGLEGPDTGGSQFFVTLSRQPHLDGRYPRFGRVVAGQEVVDRTEQGDRVISVTVLDEN